MLVLKAVLEAVAGATGLFLILIMVYQLAIGLLLIWALIVFSRYLILPRMMDNSQGVHPLATLASLFVGLMLFGVVGIVLGPVILAIALSLFRQLRDRPLLTAK